MQTKKKRKKDNRLQVTGYDFPPILSSGKIFYVSTFIYFRSSKAKNSLAEFMQAQAHTYMCTTRNLILIYLHKLLVCLTL